VKVGSSTWIADHHQRTFSWQEGYGAFTVSGSLLRVTREYIQRQEEHHKKYDSLEELHRILQDHGIAPDPRYFE